MSTSLAIPDGLSTIIGRMDTDASGKMINEAMRSTMDRLRTWEYTIQSQSYTARPSWHYMYLLTMKFA